MKIVAESMEVRTRSGQEDAWAGAPSGDVAPGPPQLSKPFGGLLDGIPVGVYRTTPTGAIVDGNAALAKILGYPDVHSLRSADAQEMYVDPKARRD